MLSEAEAWTVFRNGQYINRYTYNGKQAQTEMGWEWLNYGARYYDGLIGRWTSVDPLATRHPYHSPYVYCANSPIIYIDPDGRDWYKDKEGSFRYNSELNKGNASKILGENEKYLGASFTDNTKNGSNVYRKDGSIEFGSQADGVAYMIWATTKDGDSGGKQREQFAFISGQSMLVTPDKNNNSTTSNPEASGYCISNGTYYDPIINNGSEFSATVHTHPKDNKYPRTGNYASGEDVRFAKLKHPSAVGFVLGLGMNKVTVFNGKEARDTGISISQIATGARTFPIY